VERVRSVLLLSDHAMAADAASDALGGGAVVTRGRLTGHWGAVPADVVVVEQTIAGSSTPLELDRLAAVTQGDAPILTVISDGSDRYHWIRLRPAGGRFRYEASGISSLQEAVSLATGG
jgi:hypothetical protein